ncbi:hypothetical protein KIW84_041925 [Lathyrus oleraceus]|uniref:Plus3 domain-containing protein n=1 Tax=Pisum sativum TaxID=3888 RepID=A0A9D4XE00_PEA|nr:hypothetical protein KIW84_041925 [Pisum sativum]
MFCRYQSYQHQVCLKRSLVEELLKDLETFETKVVRSFIRIKCDPNDYLQENSHQLLRITGIKKSSGVDGEIRLQASGFIKDISINMLSDDKLKNWKGTYKEGTASNPLPPPAAQPYQILPTAEMTVSAALKLKGSSIEGIESWPYEASACQIKIKKDHLVFAGKWQLIRNRLEVLHSGLVSTENCDSGENSLLSRLVTSIVVTVNECHDLGQRCVDVAYSGKLLMQSDLIVAFAKLDGLARRLFGDIQNRDFDEWVCACCFKTESWCF